jgi:asparagine synthase (glutamine-hydrolysing)
MLSGGVDSSLITALAAEQRDGVAAFTASVTDQPAADESPLRARGLRAPRHRAARRADGRAVVAAGLVDVVRHLEAPMLHESSVPMSQIAGLARQRGVPVLLSGEGADELFGGYGWLHAAEWRDAVGRRGAPEQSLRRVARRLRQRRRGVPWPQMEPGTGPSAVVRDYERDVLRRARRAYAAAPASERPLAAALLGDLLLYLPHLLNRQDKTTMLASVETRLPFLDPAWWPWR